MAQGIPEGKKEGGSMQIVAAVVLAGVMSYAWLRLAVLLFPLSDLLCLVGWAIEGVVVALAARVAGRWRWAVGVPLLLVLVGGTAALFTLGMEGLAGTGRYAPPRGLVAGVVLGMLIIGPAILAPAAEGRGRSQAPPAPARFRSLRWHLSALAMALGALGVMVAMLLVARSGRQRGLEQIGRDLRPAVEDLVRTDVLPDLGPVTWEGPRWMGQNRVVALGTVAGGKGALRWYGELPLRQFGEPGRAEGLRAGALGLSLEVVQPRRLTDQEVGDLDSVKALLTSVGVLPELVAGLSPGMPDPDSRGMYTASRNGLVYVVTVNKPGGTSYLHTVDTSIGECMSIACGGVRSTASP